MYLSGLSRFFVKTVYKNLKSSSFTNGGTRHSSYGTSSFALTHKAPILLVHPHGRTYSAMKGINRNSLLVPNTCRDVTVRKFRLSKPNNAIPPVILLAISRVAKFGAAFLGRSVRNWWKGLPPEKKAEYAARAKKNRKYLYGLLFTFSGGLYFYYISSIQETPFTKRKRFVAFSPDQFDMIAKDEFKVLLQLHKDKIVPPSNSNPAYNRVTRVAYRLLHANKDISAIKEKDWTITVVDDDTIQNAFVLPCGNIFVFTGMLDICEDDDDLGVVLGHEMAHAVLGHGAENASHAHLLDLIILFPVAFLWAVLPTDISAAFYSWIAGTVKSILLTLPYVRELEREADTVGLFLAAKACFDVRVAPVFWAKMAVAAEKSGMPQVEWISTHPTHESRGSHLDELMEQSIALRHECQCPKLYPNFDPKKRLQRFQDKVEKSPSYENLAVRLRI